MWIMKVLVGGHMKAPGSNPNLQENEKLILVFHSAGHFIIREKTRVLRHILSLVFSFRFLKTKPWSFKHTFSFSKTWKTKSSNLKLGFWVPLRTTHLGGFVFVVFREFWCPVNCLCRSEVDPGKLSSPLTYLWGAESQKITRSENKIVIWVAIALPKLTLRFMWSWKSNCEWPKKPQFSKWPFAV